MKKHYDFILQFWTPNKEAYKSLAMTYILPSPYRDSYEEVAQGLGKYHYDAVGPGVAYLSSYWREVAIVGV